MNNITYKLETPEETERFDEYNHKEENRLEELFKLLGLTEYAFSPRNGENAFEGYDATFTKDGKQYVVEAKVRNYKIDSFTTHPLLEHKADGLYNHWLENKKILYIQFFTDGAVIYNLSTRFNLRASGDTSHQLVASTRLMANNTAKERGDSLKQVYDLSPTEELKDRVIPYKVNPLFFLNKKVLK